MQMDLPLKAETARNAVVWVLNCIGAVLLLWATSSYGNSSSPGRDYLFEAETRGGRITLISRTEVSRPSTKQTSVVSYQAFDGQYHDLVEHHGHYVTVLLPDSPNEGEFFTPDHVEEMLDRLDMLYVLYKELLHVEPAGSGSLNIAFVPQTCGMGCGMIGSKGIEILSDPRNYENIIRELDAGRLETILVHEMAHNFDGFSQYLHYLPDHAHAWTDMFEFFAPYRYARNTLNNESPDDIYNSPVRSVWKKYMADETADWKSCVKEQACEEAGLTANNLWAMLYYRIETMYGVEALLDSFTYIAEYVRQNPPPKTDQDKEDLRILSLAVGVGANIACDMDALKWPLSSNTRNELQKRFGNSNPFCGDADQDGLSVVNGDCDDNDPARNIFSQEIAGNGLDDDCDELVDEDMLIEANHGGNPDNFVGQVQTHLPFEVEGSASDTEDRDTFRFSLTPSGRTRVTICANDEFKGWAVALKPDGGFLDVPNWFTYQPAAGCTSNTFDYETFSNGGLTVIPDESVGAYSVIVSEAAELFPDHSVYLQVKPRAFGSVVLQVNDRDGLFDSLGTDEVEFWISGAGLQFFRPFSPNMTIQMTLASFPQLTDDGLYQVRMRPRANGMPLAAFSAGQLFHYGAGFNKPATVDHSFSGAWFDPEHEGEGFIVEVLDNDQALVYWFTYHVDGSQRWLLGTGVVQGDRLVVEDMMDSHGGQFGDDFDPNDVTLRARGSVTITFLSCSQALVNYSIDNNGGHQSLDRLTEIYGHGCGQTETPPRNDLSGSWYDPSHDGEGFIVEQLSEQQALVFWFTYDATGKQSWMLNTGSIEGNQISFPELLQPVGGKFGRSFDPNDVSRKPWGELTLELDCSGGAAVYQPEMGGYSSGSQNLVPLTRLQNSGCH
jgi:hypothetical protein